jgi:hypothetical protein
MASKRTLKRHVNYMIHDVIDECFFFQEMNPSKAESAEKWINDAVHFHMEVTGAISKAKSKADYKPIYASIEAKQKEYLDALNSLA